MAQKKAVTANTVMIEGEMTIFNAAAIQAQLLQAMQSGSALQVDLSAVTEFDTAGLQLMVAAKKMADQQQIRLQFSQPTTPVVELLTLSAMTALVA